VSSAFRLLETLDDTINRATTEGVTASEEQTQPGRARYRTPRSRPLMVRPAPPPGRLLTPHSAPHASAAARANAPDPQAPTAPANLPSHLPSNVPEHRVHRFIGGRVGSRTPERRRARSVHTSPGGRVRPPAHDETAPGVRGNATVRPARPGVHLLGGGVGPACSRVHQPPGRAAAAVDGDPHVPPGARDRAGRTSARAREASPVRHAEAQGNALAPVLHIAERTVPSGTVRLRVGWVGHVC
jgi:hypothetical protein